MPNETQAKHHHLIPRTYMTAWSHNNATLRIELKNNPGVVLERNNEKIACITDFYTIKAGMPFCTQADADEFFAPVSPYIVSYEGKVIQDTYELNGIYYDFDKWIITRQDGSIVSKKHIRSEIEKIKIRDIEANWGSKYENNWKSQVSIIENKILNASSNAIDAFDREYIMKFFTALDWRGFASNAQFESVLSWLCNDILSLDKNDIPKEERILPSLKTVEEEMRHDLLLHYYRQYLNDTGVIYQVAMKSLKYTSFHFLVADGPTLFITSDTPAFVHERQDGSHVGLLPITPRIMLAQVKNTDSDDLYYITHITDENVKRCNTVIRKHADEFVILNW